MLAATFAAIGFWWGWYSAILQVAEHASPWRFRLILFALPLACFAASSFILKSYSSYDVRDSTQYMFFYLVLTAGWLGVVHLAFEWMGVSARDDVLERRNGAALCALCGAFPGVTFAFAGGNIGNGPGVEVVLFSSGMATATFFAQWAILERFSRHSPHETITIVRDAGAGLRLGGYLAAIGMILGWSVAGDWISPGQTIADFVNSAWPSLVVTAAAIGVEALYGPRVHSTFSHLVASLGIAALYVFAAAEYILWRGLWQ
jgi:hypothetical protein